MVKPALPYLDVIRARQGRDARCRSPRTTSAASTRWSRRPPRPGYLDERAAVLETLTVDPPRRRRHRHHLPREGRRPMASADRQPKIRAAARTAPPSRSTTLDSACSTSCRAASRSSRARTPRVAEQAGITEERGARARRSSCSTTASSARSRRSSTRARSATARCSSPPRSTPSTRGAPRRSSTRTPASRTTTCATTTSTCGSRSRSRRTRKLGLQGTLDVLAGARPAPSRSASCRRSSSSRSAWTSRWRATPRTSPPPVEAVEPRRARAVSPTTTSTSPSSAPRRATCRSSPSPTRPPPPELGITGRRLLEHLARHAGARPAAPRRRDPLPPPRRLLRQRHGRLEGARRPDPRDRPADGRLPRHLALLPAPDLRGLALLASSRWPTAARRRSATRSSTRSPTSTGITERATLYSSTEFKKIRLLYFTDDFKDWEREHAGV